MSTTNQFLEKKCQKFAYDVAVDGSMTAATSIVLGTLPKGALITGGSLHIVTDMVDADAGDDTTIAFGYTGATAAFVAATAVSSLETGTRFSILPGSPILGDDAAHTTAALFAALVSASELLMATDIRVLATVGVGVNITAGKFNLFVEYYIST